jgi:hypothetical protein
MHAGFSFSYSPISLLLRQPLSIKKSYAGAIQSYLIICPTTSLRLVLYGIPPIAIPVSFMVFSLKLCCECRPWSRTRATTTVPRPAAAASTTFSLPQHATANKPFTPSATAISPRRRHHYRTTAAETVRITSNTGSAANFYFFHFFLNFFY